REPGAAEIAGPVGAGRELQLAAAGEIEEPLARIGSDEANAGPGGEQAGDLLLGGRRRAEDDREPAGEVEGDRVGAHDFISEIDGEAVDRDARAVDVEGEAGELGRDLDPDDTRPADRDADPLEDRAGESAEDGLGLPGAAGELGSGRGPGMEGGERALDLRAMKP